ncbi:hypothetical protein C8R44DRAFT_728973 [Mycena epipterygia]|nr:hypothetical protein C8R44DRAFT_728973 [Mycena epipterygia]
MCLTLQLSPGVSMITVWKPGASRFFSEVRQCCRLMADVYPPRDPENQEQRWYRRRWCSVPNNIYEHPGDYGVLDFKWIKADPEAVNQVRSVHAPTNHKVFELVPPDFQTIIAEIYISMGEPPVTHAEQSAQLDRMMDEDEPNVKGVHPDDKGEIFAWFSDEEFLRVDLIWMNGSLEFNAQE